MVRIADFHCHGSGSVPGGELRFHKSHGTAKKKKKLNLLFISRRLEIIMVLVKTKFTHYEISSVYKQVRW